jgi:hypothetical protein
MTTLETMEFQCDDTPLFYPECDLCGTVMLDNGEYEANNGLYQECADERWA